MRLYKAVITDIPEAAKVPFMSVFDFCDGDTPEDWGFRTWDDAETLVQDPGWKPEGWEEFIDSMAARGDCAWAKDCQSDDYRFFWPKLGGMYRSQSSAKSKAKMAEKWGATVTIMEAEVSEFRPVAEMNARRKHNRDVARARKLRDEGYRLEARADAYLRRAIPETIPDF